MNSQKIYILLTQTGTIVSQAIKFFTKEPYNHASLGFDKSLEKELFSFGRYYTYFPFWGGFINENIRKGLFSKKQNTKACVYEISVSPEAYEKLRNLVDEIKKNRKKHRFNIIGMVSVALNIPLRRKYKKFCAEFVSELLTESDIHTFNKNHALARPHDFHNIKNSKKIYEGLLINYSREGV